MKKAYEAATVERVAEGKEHAKDRGSGSILLLGAGVSVTAGIPAARDIVKAIKERHPAAARECLNPDSYPALMTCLSPIQQRTLINGYINNAKINWAHIAIAQMIKFGYIKYVLTTNFDPILSRACALANVFPAIYDLATASDYNMKSVHSPAIFHLHGQHTGFKLLNTQNQVDQHAARIKPVFTALGTAAPWIVCGYSGDCDPVAECLVGLGEFQDGLYWAGFKDAVPSEDLQSRLFACADHRWISGHDADSFFVALARKLGCLEPRYILSPFSHLLDMLEPVMEFGTGEQPTVGAAFKLVERARETIQRAIDHIEIMGHTAPGGSAGGDVMSTDLSSSLITDDEATRLYLAGKYATLLERLEGATQPPKGITKALAALAAVTLAYDCHTQASLSADGREATLKAGLQYALKAQQISPSEPWAYLAEADCLASIAAKMTERECNQYYEEAFAKYEMATEMKPDFHEAFSNWGNELGKLARTKSGAKRDALFQDAFAKYARATEIKPDFDTAFYNWGNDLGALARTKGRLEHAALYQEAFAKYARATEIRPDKHEAFYNWGSTLGDLARTKDGLERDALYQEAFAKYARATEIMPDKHEAFNNWGSDLGDLARTKDGLERDALFQEAFAKYARATEIKPDKHEAFNNWGSTLGALALTKDGPDRDAIFQEAFAKYAHATEIKPDDHDAFNNWGSTLGALARTKDGPEREALYQKALARYARATEIKPDDHDAFNNWGSTLLTMATTKEGQERERLLVEAEKHLTRAYSLHPAVASYNMTCLAALRGQPDRARGYLEEALTLGTLPDRAHLESDTDLDSLRGLPWFKELLEKALRG